MNTDPYQTPSSQRLSSKEAQIRNLKVMEAINATTLPLVLSIVGLLLPILLIIGPVLAVKRRLDLKKIESELLADDVDGGSQLLINQIRKSYTKLTVAIAIPLVLLVVFMMAILLG